MDDLISRQSAIDALLHNQEVYSNNFGDDAIDKYTVAIIDNDAQTIAQLPSAQRKGKWIATQEWGGRNYSCSCCKFSFMVETCMLEPLWNFCPNCGAEMKGESGEESL